VILVFAIIGSLLPHGYSLSATQQINAAPNVVYSQIDSMPDWKSWSQWDPDSIKDLTVTYGADGKSQRWTDVRGDGKLWITDQKPDERIDYRMRFASFPEMDASIALTSKDGGTLVTWTSEGTLPSGPFYGYFRHVFVSGMTRQYQQSLSKLKKIIEDPEVDDPEVEGQGPSEEQSGEEAEAVQSSVQ